MTRKGAAISITSMSQQVMSSKFLLKATKIFRDKVLESHFNKYIYQHIWAIIINTEKRLLTHVDYFRPHGFVYGTGISRR